jgi:hypothetical protein
MEEAGIAPLADPLAGNVHTARDIAMIIMD